MVDNILRYDKNEYQIDFDLPIAPTLKLCHSQSGWVRGGWGEETKNKI